MHPLHPDTPGGRTGDVNGHDGAPPAGPGTSGQARRGPIWRSLFFQLVVAVALGVSVGHFLPHVGENLKPLGDGFIKLIKMVIAPLIFCVVVTGIAKVGDTKGVGRIALKAFVYFEVITTGALLFGLVVANVVKPGAGLNIDPSTLDASAVAGKTEGEELPHAADFLLNIIPASAVDAFAQNQLLQVLLFSVLFGFALAQFGEKGSPIVLEFIEHLQHVIFRIVGYIMKLAPVGAFGAMGFIIGQYGIESLSTYGILVASCYGAAFVFLLLLAVIAKLFAGVNLWHFVKYTREELALALGTASSESVMPRIMNKLQNAGCGPAPVGLVIPTGYSFNLDGASIYLTLAIVFMAQALNIDLSLADQLTIVGVLLLTSKSMAGVPGSSFLALSATATAVGGFPAGAVALMLGADRFMDSMRVTTNLLGNCVATFVIAKWENMLDSRRMRAVLAGEPVEDDVPALGEEELERIAHGREAARPSAPAPLDGVEPAPQSVAP